MTCSPTGATPSAVAVRSSRPMTSAASSPSSPFRQVSCTPTPLPTIGGLDPTRTARDPSPRAGRQGQTKGAHDRGDRGRRLAVLESVPELGLVLIGEADSPPTFPAPLRFRYPHRDQ